MRVSMLSPAAATVSDASCWLSKPTRKRDGSTVEDVGFGVFACAAPASARVATTAATTPSSRPRVCDARLDIVRGPSIGGTAAYSRSRPLPRLRGRERLDLDPLLQRER